MHSGTWFHFSGSCFSSLYVFLSLCTALCFTHSTQPQHRQAVEIHTLLLGNPFYWGFSYCLSYFKWFSLCSNTISVTTLHAGWWFKTRGPSFSSPIKTCMHITCNILAIYQKRRYRHPFALNGGNKVQNLISLPHYTASCFSVLLLNTLYVKKSIIVMCYLLWGKNPASQQQTQVHRNAKGK